MPTNDGNTKYIQTPGELWKLFCEYMEWIASNPYRVQDYVGKDGQMVYRDKQRPLTFAGFEKWLALEDVINDLGDYEKNRNGAYSDYSPIITRIRKICNGEILEGASAGVYNAMIASKVAGLVEKSEQTIKEEPRVFKVD
jgi:hypothetical protein